MRTRSPNGTAEKQIPLRMSLALYEQIKASADAKAETVAEWLRKAAAARLKRDR